jgi:hypothetical protein
VPKCIPQGQRTRLVAGAQIKLKEHNNLSPTIDNQVAKEKVGAPSRAFPHLERGAQMKGPPEACPAAHRALKIDCFMNDPAPVAQTCHWRAEDANQKCCSSKGTKKLLRGGHRSSPYRAFCRWPSAHFFAFSPSFMGLNGAPKRTVIL